MTYTRFSSLDRRGKLILALILAAASIAIIFALQYVYLNYYQPYAHLVVTQVDTRLFEPWPPFAEFSALPDGTFEEYPRLKEAFSQVQKEFERVISDCSVSNAVYCDLASNTRVTSDITANELESLLKSRNINFYGTVPDGEWIAYVTRDDCYTADILIGVRHLEDADAMNNNRVEQKCYYAINLERIYHDNNQLSGYKLVTPIK